VSDAYNPQSASLEAKRAYWAEHGVGGNRVDAQRAADEAYNAAVLNGPYLWRFAYPLRQVSA